MRHFLNFIYKHAKIVIAIVVLLTVFFAYQATKIGLNASYSAFIPWGEYSDSFEGGVSGQLPVLSKTVEEINDDIVIDTTVYKTGAYASTTTIENEKVEDLPYDTNYLVLIKGENIYKPDNLNLIERCIKELEDTRELSKASSVLDFITLEKKGTRLATVPMASNRENGWNEENAALLKQRIENDPVVSYYLVGGSKQSFMFTFRTAVVDQAKEQEFSDMLNPLRDAGLEVYINGGGVINNKVMEYLNKDLVTLVGLSLLIILLVYYLCFKSKRSVLLPMSVSVIGLIWTFGMMAMLKIDISILNIVTPCMVITLGSAYSIQLLSNYYANFNLPEEKRLGATARILTTILFACLTTVCGFLVLLISQTEGLREFGIAVSFGVAFCAILAITYLPATLHLLKSASPKQVTRYKEGLVAKFVNKLSNFVIKYWVYFLILLIIITVGFFFVKDKISIDSNYMSYFPESDPFGRESKIFASEMGGTNPFMIYIYAPQGEEKFFLQPENLQKVFEYEQTIMQSPDILQSISFPSYVAFANEIYSGEHSIPEQKGLLNVLSKLIIVMQNQTGANLDAILSSDGNSLSLTIQHWDSVEKDLMSTSSCTRIEYILTENLDLLPAGTKVRIAGDPIVNVKFANRLLADQQLTTIMSIFIVFVLLVLAFRSLSKSLFALVPIASGIMINYLFMYFMDIPFDMVTVSFSSIAIGCGIDDAIHFILKYQNLKKLKIHDENEILHETMVTTGKPIILTTLSVVAGLMMLSFASYTPIRYFGLLMSVTLFSCMLATLIFMPPVMILVSNIKKKFSSKRG